MLRKKLRLSSSQEFSSEASPTKELNSFPTEIQLSNDFNIQDSTHIPTTLLQYATSLNEKLSNFTFPSPVYYVYNPVEYAFDMFATFTQKYCKSEKKILLLGMNPGPWGMVQTGIPFGEIKMVKEWYKIEAKINKPAIECPARKVMGLNCLRTEVSGKRLYEFFQNVCGTPENFFQHTFLYNWCPLAFMEKGGRNVTPDIFKGSVKKELEDCCSETLMEILKLLKTEIIITFGKYAEKQVHSILKKHNINNVEVICMPHPSPRAAGNTNWIEKAQKVLEDHELLKYFSQ